MNKDEILALFAEGDVSEGAHHCLGRGRAEQRKVAAGQFHEEGKT